MTNHDVEGCPQGSSGGRALSATSMLDRDTLFITVLLEQVRTEGERLLKGAIMRLLVVLCGQLGLHLKR